MLKKCYWVFKKKTESLKITDFLLLYFYMHLSNAINDFISQSIPFNFRHLDLLNIKQFLQLDLI